ncbi:uncharacterized protein E6C27_scaffold41G00610 [Cucumis melo var. makuwa]|uniref:Uncharacterized protein n=1 Tax=Cucumis melo var. makuwa TaxID=1194695 RepID=A0A5A7V6Y8_CUCMM|nr:uncharacterized protein E6C27_scaffold41G00610 [Cucumis melo var. makuwa]
MSIEILKIPQLFFSLFRTVSELLFLPPTSGQRKAATSILNLLPHRHFPYSSKLCVELMASKLHQLQSKACQATQFACKHGTSYYKQLLEQNKQYIQEPATVEKCSLLSKQLLYTRLASIPGRYESFWKELDYVKNLWKNRQELKVEDAGIAALFGLECFAWFCAGEIVGRGFTFTVHIAKSSERGRHGTEELRRRNLCGLNMARNTIISILLLLLLLTVVSDCSNNESRLLIDFDVNVKFSLLDRLNVAELVLQLTAILLGFGTESFAELDGRVVLVKSLAMILMPVAKFMTNVLKEKANNLYHMGFSGLTNVKCHEKFKSCIKKVQKSGKVGFSKECPYSTAVPTMVQGMDLAIMFSQFGNSKLEL